MYMKVLRYVGVVELQRYSKGCTTLSDSICEDQLFPLFVTKQLDHKASGPEGNYFQKSNVLPLVEFKYFLSQYQVLPKKHNLHSYRINLMIEVVCEYEAR
ncbi:hypothetical protein H5410_057791 [Solanum commersonii]|uniref:Uncharacterized protein n=1 Tax=Solanum commersonii TaxID=4109 RepID=A0A9J5WP47_SOLCO|nr:hypothetical protein H5410_057791 [Solanum commersonii]